MNKFAPLYVIIAASLWGIDGIVLRPSLYGLPVPLVVLIESAIVALILSPFFVRKFPLLQKLTGRDWLAFIGVAIFGGAIGTMAITKALFYVNFVNLSIVVLIQKLQPVFAISLAAVLLREKLDKKFFLWAALAIIGAYIMSFGFSPPQIGGDNKTIFAVLFALLATFSFAASTVFSKRGLKNVDFQLGSYLRFVITTLLMLIIVSLSGEFPATGGISTQQWLVFLLIAFTTGGPAIFLYYFGLRKISASVSTICELSFPLTAILLEYFIRDHLLAPSQWLGVILLFFSIYMVSGINPLRKMNPATR